MPKSRDEPPRQLQTRPSRRCATLAGLSGADVHDVHDVLPAALADCAAPIPASDAAAAQVAFIKPARMHADDRAAESWVLDKVCQIVTRSDYAKSVVELPLGQIFDLSDEWGAGWGRTEQQLELEVQNACRTQLAAREASDDH